MSILKRNIPQPAVRKENSEGFLLAWVCVGMLKGILKNDLVIQNPSLHTALSSFIKKVTSDKTMSARMLHLERLSDTNADVKKWHKSVAKGIRKLGEMGTEKLIQLTSTTQTHVSLTDDEYEAVSEQAHCIYLFCPTKKWEQTYREQINDFDEYVDLAQIVLINSNDFEVFKRIHSVGYFYSPKPIELSDRNKQRVVTNIETVNKILALDKPSINVV